MPWKAIACVGLYVVVLGSSGGCGGGGGAEDLADTALALHRFSGLSRVQSSFYSHSPVVLISGATTSGTAVGAVIDSSDQGRSVFIGPEDDAQFEALATLLTNGENDVLEFSARNYPFPDAVESIAEGGAWQALRSDVVDPDLAGYRLTSIEIRVTTLSYSEPGPTGVTQRFDVTFILHGQPL